VIPGQGERTHRGRELIGVCAAVRSRPPIACVNEHRSREWDFGGACDLRGVGTDVGFGERPAHRCAGCKLIGAHVRLAHAFVAVDVVEDVSKAGL
jgi:hypothetical protein